MNGDNSIELYYTEHVEKCPICREDTKFRLYNKNTAISCWICFINSEREKAKREVYKDILDIWTHANKEAMNTKQLLREVRYRIEKIKGGANNGEEFNKGSRDRNRASSY